MDQAITEFLNLGRRLTGEVLEPLKKMFIDKDEIVDLIGLCLVAGENLFLLGPPGTAKSALVRELGRKLAGRTFEYLLTRFTEPSELFGPFDIRKLRDGELVPNTDGMLPEASLVFLDELLNANSAILNSLLTVLNERTLRRGRETRALPALVFISASNRLPDDDYLGALFDRFLVRVMCDNVGQERLGEVLTAGWRLDLNKDVHPASLAVEDVARLHSGIELVNLEQVRPLLVEMVLKLRRAGMAISDRRAVKLQRLVGASALLSGRQEAIPSDLWVFRHIWDTVEQQEILREVVGELMRKTPAALGDHPRARSADTPDPESLARDLESIQKQLDGAGASAADRSLLRDRVGILAARAQWVKNDDARRALEGTINGLWQRFE